MSSMSWVWFCMSWVCTLVCLESGFVLLTEAAMLKLKSFSLLLSDSFDESLEEPFSLPAPPLCTYKWVEPYWLSQLYCMGPVVSTLTMQMLSEPLLTGHMVSMTIPALPQWCVSSLQCTFGLDNGAFLLAKREKGNIIFLSEPCWGTLQGGSLSGFKLTKGILSATALTHKHTHWFPCFIGTSHRRYDFYTV